MSNRYFEVDKPFTYYRLLGSRLSNTWIGASRVHENVYEKREAVPGDLFHDLVGGLFVEFADAAEGGAMARFSPEVHIFEAKYHTFDEQFARDRLIKDGCLVELPEAITAPNYKSWREASSKRFGKLVEA